MTTLSRSPYFDKDALERFKRKLLLSGILFGSVRWEREVRRFRAEYRMNRYQVNSPSPANYPMRTRDDNMVVSIHADMVKIKATYSPRPETTIPRGNVSSFSRKSRQRMIELLADEIRVPDLFITLTFSDDCYYDWMGNHKKNLEAFRRRLERNYPGISAIWRLEIENRKSGDWHGEPMPHYHLIIWLPEGANETFNYQHSIDNNHEWSKWWHEITGSENEFHKFRGFDMSKVKSRRQSYHYVSKYVSKSSVDNMEVGRRWGRFGTVGQGSRADEIITKREYIHLKRLIMSYLKLKKTKTVKKHTQDGRTIEVTKEYRNKELARKYARKNVHVGMTIFGLGVWNSPEFDIDKSTIKKMIDHARELARMERDEKNTRTI